MKPYWRVTLLYFLFGILWIVFTDFSSYLHTPEAAKLTIIQMVKGSLYVLISTLLILYTTKSSFEKFAAQEQERHKLFVRTIKASHHILRNFLNQMQLVTLEAERCQNFDKRTLEIALQVTDEAEREINKLAEIEFLIPETISPAVPVDAKREQS